MLLIARRVGVSLLDYAYSISFLTEFSETFQVFKNE